jgi:P-type E1-E2 ATPase
MRDGKWIDLHSKYLVCGDIIQIVEGMNIPCDGFVLKGNEVLTDESAMTGETDAIRKGSMMKCEGILNNSNRIDYEDSL